MAIPPEEWADSPFNLDRTENNGRNEPPHPDPEPETNIEPTGNITFEDIQDHLAELDEKMKRDGQNTGIFTAKQASEWLLDASKRPIPKMLFDKFWMEGELAILFADTNVGKSILAVQIADSISRGEPVPGFKFEAAAQPVLYFDFELSDKQFENRYSNDFTNHFPFHPNFIRVEINPDALPDNGDLMEQYIRDSMERLIIKTGAKAAIIDNITYLRRETEKAKDALPLMKGLKTLKSKHHLSLLILAHTPKRDNSKPILLNDLQGSKTLANFCDGSFAIGASTHDTNMRYIKQLKVRSTECVFGAENVCLCNIVKFDNFLQFDFLQYGREKEHLKEVKEDEREKLEEQIKEMLLQEPNCAPYVIAKKLCPEEKNLNSFQVKVSRIIKRIKNGT